MILYQLISISLQRLQGSNKNCSIFVSLGTDEVECRFEKGTSSQLADLRFGNMIFFEELSDAQDGRKLECRAKTRGWKTEFNLLVICECNMVGLGGVRYKWNSSIRV